MTDPFGNMMTPSRVRGSDQNHELFAVPGMAQAQGLVLVKEAPERGVTIQRFGAP